MSIVESVSKHIANEISWTKPLTKVISELGPTWVILSVTPAVTSLATVVFCLIISSLTSRIAKEQGEFEEVESELMLKELKEENTSQDKSDMTKHWLKQRVDWKIRLTNGLKIISVIMFFVSVLLIILVSFYVNIFRNIGE